MISVSWPCRVSRDTDGRYSVSPFQLLGCDGAGGSLLEAETAARLAIADHLHSRAGEFIVPPIVMIDPDDIFSGRLTRVHLELP
jgi:predicted RNase H-like HicB family nuclease